MNNQSHLMTAVETGHRLNVRKTKTYALVAEGLITDAVKVGKLSFWPIDEIELLAAAFAAGLPKVEIKQIVRELHARRRQRFNEMRASILAGPASPSGYDTEPVNQVSSSKVVDSHAA